MEKKEVIEIATGLGFQLDLDNWDTKGWLRFILDNELDDKDLRWIWYKNTKLQSSLWDGARILFRAGQKAKIKQLTSYIEL